MLLKQLLARGSLKTPSIISAFRAIDRLDFIVPTYQAHAYDDTPLPIYSGQTISQPTTVATMLELLQPSLGDKVLDVGSGSGWTTALLSTIVGPSGKVYAAEILLTVFEFGQKNISKYRLDNVIMLRAGKELGLPKYAPYDKILVSAAATEMPTELIAQLAVGGTMVIPVGNSVVKVKKLSDTEVTTEDHPGFTFVPLILPHEQVGLNELALDAEQPKAELHEL